MSNIVQAYTPLKQADFTIVNKDNRTITDGAGGINIIAPARAAGATNLCALYKASPSTPYTVTAHFTNNTTLATTIQYHFGICFFDSVNSKTDGLTGQTNSAAPSDCYWVTIYYGNTTTQTNQWAYANNIYYEHPRWQRIKDDGVNRTFWGSRDGINWTQLATTGRTTNMTPNGVGFFVEPKGIAVYFSCDSFKIDTSG